MQKPKKPNLDLKLLISILILSFTANSQNMRSSIDVQKVNDPNGYFTDCIADFIKNKSQDCSDGEFFYYIDFYDEKKFYISRLYEDYNNFMESCAAYIVVDERIVFIQKSDFWKNYYQETGRYKTFSYLKTDNGTFFPAGYQSDSRFYKIENGNVILERLLPCKRK